MDERVRVEVEDRTLSLSNLGKVLYPETGFTKGEVIDYYTRVAPALLPHVVDRPLTVVRWPDGVGGKSFFEKNAPSHTPDWVRTVTLPVPGSSMNRGEIRYILIEDLPTVVWAANLASLEMHVPQWRVGPRGGVKPPDRLVLDLDPGPPADVVACAAVALLLRDLLVDDGLEPVAKTSGSKGLQLYCAVQASSDAQTSAYAKRLGERLENEHAKLVVSRMAKDLRPGKVFVDWSQNNAAKTTVAPYSLRARPLPTVSTPVTWDEIEACEDASDLRFTAPEVLERVRKSGDLFSPLLGAGRPIPVTRGGD
ncbi:MAG: non-homologous end-joining DNA ligase [Candidatus Nanopelagicales bacterium]